MISVTMWENYLAAVHETDCVCFAVRSEMNSGLIQY